MYFAPESFKDRSNGSNALGMGTVNARVFPPLGIGKRDRLAFEVNVFGGQFVSRIGGIRCVDRNFQTRSASNGRGFSGLL